MTTHLSFDFSRAIPATFQTKHGALVCRVDVQGVTEEDRSYYRRNGLPQPIVQGAVRALDRFDRFIPEDLTPQLIAISPIQRGMSVIIDPRQDFSSRGPRHWSGPLPGLGPIGHGGFPPASEWVGRYHPTEGPSGFPYGGEASGRTWSTTHPVETGREWWTRAAREDLPHHYLHLKSGQANPPERLGIKRVRGSNTKYSDLPEGMVVLWHYPDMLDEVERRYLQDQGWQAIPEANRSLLLQALTEYSLRYPDEYVVDVTMVAMFDPEDEPDFWLMGIWPEHALFEKVRDEVTKKVGARTGYSTGYLVDPWIFGLELHEDAIVQRVSAAIRDTQSTLVGAIQDHQGLGRTDIEYFVGEAIRKLNLATKADLRTVLGSSSPVNRVDSRLYSQFSPHGREPGEATTLYGDLYHGDSHHEPHGHVESSSWKKWLLGIGLGAAAVAWIWRWVKSPQAREEFQSAYHDTH